MRVRGGIRLADVLAAANHPAQIGRLGPQTARQRVQHRPRHRGSEPAIEQFHGFQGPFGRRRHAEHHRNQAFVAALGGRHDIETGGADKAGFHAGCAFITADNAIGVFHHLVADLDGG